MSTDFAVLLQQELSHRGTRWEPEELTLSQIRQIRKNAGLASCASETQKWISQCLKKGAMQKRIGSRFHNGRLVREVRYKACPQKQT